MLGNHQFFMGKDFTKTKTTHCKTMKMKLAKKLLTMVYKGKRIYQEFQMTRKFFSILNSKKTGIRKIRIF